MNAMAGLTTTIAKTARRAAHEIARAEGAAITITTSITVRSCRRFGQPRLPRTDT
jgi:hypothetical protein